MYTKYLQAKNIHVSYYVCSNTALSPLVNKTYFRLPRRHESNYESDRYAEVKGIGVTSFDYPTDVNAKGAVMFLNDRRKNIRMLIHCLMKAYA
jgi:hypothetical protein